MKKDITSYMNQNFKYWVFENRNGTYSGKKYYLKRFDRKTGEKRKVIINAAIAKQIEEEFLWFETKIADAEITRRRNRRKRVGNAL